MLMDACGLGFGVEGLGFRSFGARVRVWGYMM